MSSIAVQTEETANEINVDSSICNGLFTQILSILDDEHNKFYYDISESYLDFSHELPTNNGDGSNTNGIFEVQETCFDDGTAEIQVNNGNTEEMTIAELERSLQISESRLRTNLNELNKITSALSSASHSSTSSTEHIKEWLNSTGDHHNSSSLNSPGVELGDNETRNNSVNDFEMDGI
ncbi:hypothetical protein Smp_043110 [Schistosoma mansoni]|uniref:DNA-binding protein n=1 Tax=Schistosoma mansoni TaxID=6183 RepID=G4VIW8_SCHMA|nr:hypothetical protein Smp_043110 [Schistosoma mansoni]|eukprot:XP_018651974.1 hypothetical protein Smp_043110 [Schistosoma mansoni]